MTTPGDSARLEITTSFFPLSFLFFFCKTLIVIDGSDCGPVRWGTHTFAVGPGHHRVKVSARYLFFTETMANETTVELPPGGLVQVRYRAPLVTFMKGKITVVAATPAGSPAATPAGSPAGWHRDPAQRHELRYWDGTRWTEHVSDTGRAGVDPL